MVGQGEVNKILVDLVLQRISNATATIEIPLNIIMILFFLTLGVALAVVKDEQVRPFLVASIVLSMIFWCLTDAFGMILTSATDFNSGLLAVVIALAYRPACAQRSVARAWFGHSVRQIHKAASTQTGESESRS